MGRKADPAAAQGAQHPVPLKPGIQRIQVFHRWPEGEDAGAPAARRQNAAALRPQALFQVQPVLPDLVVDRLETGLQQERETGVQRVDSEHVRTARLEAPGARRRLDPRIGEVAGMLKHIPAVFLQRQPLARLRIHVEHPDPLGRQHPLVRVRHHEIRMTARGVEGQGAQVLDRIDAEQDAARAELRAQGLDIDPHAGVVAHGAGRHQARAPVAGRQQVALGLFANLDFAGLEAEALGRR